MFVDEEAEEDAEEDAEDEDVAREESGGAGC